MITRQTKLQLIVFAIIAAVGVAFTGAKYANLDRFFVDQGYMVGANFADSGGIFKNAEVTYRGVLVGNVKSLELRSDGVRLNMQLKPGTQVPNDLRVVVGNRSAVGEQFVDLQPRRDGAPYLTQGSVIPQQDTAIPISPTELLVNLDQLVNSVNTHDVGVVLDELGKAFEGSGNDLQRLVDAGNTLTEAATVNLPQTIKLIQDSKPVLDTQRDTSGQFKSYNKNLALLTTQLRASDPDFRSLFANGTKSALQTTDLIDSTRAALPVLLDNLISTAQVQQVRLPALRQTLVTYPNVVAGGFTVAPGDGTAHFGAVTNMKPGFCDSNTKGYATTNQRAPGTVGQQPANTKAYCSLPSSSGIDIRGGAHAPRPSGDQSLADSQGGTSSPGSSSSAAATRSSTGSSAAQSSASTRQLDPVTLGDYDPKSGRVITSDGQQLVIGSSSGSARLFGDQSWQWMLLGPLSAS